MFGHSVCTENTFEILNPSSVLETLIRIQHMAINETGLNFKRTIKLSRQIRNLGKRKNQIHPRDHYLV